MLFKSIWVIWNRLKNLSVSLSREISLVQPREIFRDSDVANLWRLKIWLERRGAFQLSVKLKKKRRVYAVFETSPVKSGWSQQGQYVSWQEKAVDGVIKWSDFGPDPHKFPHMFGVRCASLPNLVRWKISDNDKCSCKKMGIIVTFSRTTLSDWALLYTRRHNRFLRPFMGRLKLKAKKKSPK